MNTPAQKLIDRYRADLKNFIEKHNLSNDYYTDISDRIDEKIAHLDSPEEFQIRKILTEIGSPEEIFRDEIAESSHSISEKNTHNVSTKNILQKIVELDSRKIFLGVFYELSKKTGISANIFRTIFLAIIFLGLISGNERITVVPALLYFVLFLLLKTRFFGIAFSLCSGIIALLLLIPSIIIFGMYMTGFHVEHIYPFMGISPLFPIGLILGIFSLILFAMYFLRYAFSKKFFGVGFLITAIISCIIALSLGFVSTIEYAFNSRNTRTIPAQKFEVASTP